MGQRASNTATITFNDTEIPADYLLGEENKGFKLAMMTLDRTRPGVAAMATGIARAAFEFATDYSKERVQFGVPIAMHQAIQFMIADMATKVHLSRLATWNSAVLLDQGQRNTLESSHAKRFAADTAMEVTTDAVQVYGGYGFIKEYPVEKLMRDAKIMQLYEGTSQIQRLVIARETLLPRRVEEPPRSRRPRDGLTRRGAAQPRRRGREAPRRPGSRATSGRHRQPSRPPGLRRADPRRVGPAQLAQLRASPWWRRDELGQRPAGRVVVLGDVEDLVAGRCSRPPAAAPARGRRRRCRPRSRRRAVVLAAHERPEVALDVALPLHPRRADRDAAHVGAAHGGVHQLLAERLGQRVRVLRAQRVLLVDRQVVGQERALGEVPARAVSDDTCTKRGTPRRAAASIALKVAIRLLWKTTWARVGDAAPGSPPRGRPRRGRGRREGVAGVGQIALA